MTAPTHDTTPTVADASMLEDRIPESLRMTPIVPAYLGLLGLLYFFVSFFWKLWHTDLWGHLAYGRIIAELQSIPTTEPLLPLAAGAPFIDTAWLTQVLAFRLTERFGISVLNFMYAGSITAMSALLLYRGYRRSRSPGLALVGWLLWMWGCWGQLAVVRPQLAGMLCFTALLMLVTSRRERRWQYVVIPLLFVVWANCHGSFPVGFVLLAALAVGRTIDVAVRCGEFRAIRLDSQVRRFVLLLELSIAAALLNPYGLRLFSEVVTISNHPNMSELAEWQPLSLRMPQGQAVAAISLLLVVLYRLSPRRVTAAEVLLLFGFGAAALWSSRMIVWWVPLAAYYVVLHASAVWHDWVSPLPAQVVTRRGIWFVATIGSVFIGYGLFGMTAFGHRLQRGTEGIWTTQRLVSRQTPLTIVAKLERLKEKKTLPRGMMFNTYEWGDYLLWAGPPELKVFVASHVHLIPREVWQDYVAISEVSGGWDDLLDRHGVNLIALDQETHGILIRRLRENENWREEHGDQVGSLFVRRKPI